MIPLCTPTTSDSTAPEPDLLDEPDDVLDLTDEVLDLAPEDDDLQFSDPEPEPVRMPPPDSSSPSRMTAPGSAPSP